MTIFRENGKKSLFGKKKKKKSWKTLNIHNTILSLKCWNCLKIMLRRKSKRGFLICLFVFRPYFWEFWSKSANKGGFFSLRRHVCIWSTSYWIDNQVKYRIHTRVQALQSIIHYAILFKKISYSYINFLFSCQH